MPNDASGRWRPNTHAKQDLLRELCRTKKYVLANGPRYSGKTVGSLHCLAEHAWLTNPGNITIITISQTVGMDSGIWKDLTEHILPEWIGFHYPDKEGKSNPWTGFDVMGNPITGGNFGMTWVRAPYTDITKKPMCKVSNMYGGVTTIQLDSLQNELEAEDRFKPRRYSMIYVPELSTFQLRDTFTTWTECLRMIGLPERAHLFLADSNPPDDSSWWMHDLWWELLSTPDNELSAYALEHDLPLSEEELDALKTLRDELARMDISIPDNPFADPKHVALLKGKYAHNHDLYQRYIIGVPTRTTSDSIFAEVFRPHFHVVPELEVVNEKASDADMMFPEPDCIELMTTWDPGESTNWACQIVEKFDGSRHDPIKYKSGEPCFKFLDEVMCIGEDVDVYEFVAEVQRKMKLWEQECQKKPLWKHWSDRNVFDRRELSTRKYYHEIIHEVSGGDIALLGAEKAPGSIRSGIDLFRRLLFMDRVWFNAATCPVTIAAIKGLKKGKSNLAVIQRGSPHKHPIDSARYLLQSECYDEIGREFFLNLRKRRKATTHASTLVTVPL